MNKFSITLPVKQHNGTSNLRIINRYKKLVAVIAGGYTAQPVTGGWYDDKTNRMYTDKSVLVSTYCDDTALTQLEGTVQAIGIELQQISIMYEVLRSIDIVTLDSPFNLSVHQLEVHFVECTREQDLATAD